MPKPETAAPANLPAAAEQGEFLLYTAEDGKNVIRVRFQHESLWLSQALMAELFSNHKAEHCQASQGDFC